MSMPLAVSVHICEAFFLPGAFEAWYRRYRPDPSRIARRFLMIVIAVYLAVYMKIALLGRTPLGSGAAFIAPAAIVCVIGGSYELWSAVYHLGGKPFNDVVPVPSVFD